MVEKLDELEDRVSWIRDGQGDGTRTSSNSVGMVRYKWLLDGGKAKRKKGSRVAWKQQSSQNTGFYPFNMTIDLQPLSNLR